MQTASSSSDVYLQCTHIVCDYKATQHRYTIYSYTQAMLIQQDYNTWESMDRMQACDAHASYSL